jgi:hypothetical protein
MWLTASTEMIREDFDFTMFYCSFWLDLEEEN